ncbi:hypothetical protein AB7W72_23925, partial [Providencia rettgeri]
ESTNRNSPIPKSCHLKSVSAPSSGGENASAVSFFACFLTSVTHPFLSSLQKRRWDEFIIRFAGQTEQKTAHRTPE